VGVWHLLRKCPEEAGSLASNIKSRHLCIAFEMARREVLLIQNCIMVLKTKRSRTVCYYSFELHNFFAIWTLSGCMSRQISVGSNAYRSDLYIGPLQLEVLIMILISNSAIHVACSHTSQVCNEQINIRCLDELGDWVFHALQT